MPKNAVLLVLIASLVHCKGRGHARVEGVLVPQASGFIAPPADAVTVVFADAPKELPPIPDQPTVALAIERKVPWSEVRRLIKHYEGAGKRVLFLTGDRYRVQAMQLNDEFQGGVQIDVYAYNNGQACVQIRGAKEGKCVQSTTKDYIDRAGVREVVREAIKAMKTYQVEVEITDADVVWADVVRTVDGARTCCEAPVRVRLNKATMDAT